MKIKGRHHTFSIPYNILLVTLGCIIFGIGLKGIALPHGYISGGISGLSLLIFYWTGLLSPGMIYNISNQRKMALIISDMSEKIAAEVISRLGRGATLLEGRGAYTGRKKEVLLTVINGYQLKRLEELVFSIDEQAFVIMENTLNVLGKGFSNRKTY